MSDFPKQLRDFGSYNVMCEAADHIEHLEARLAEVEAEHAAFSNNVEQCEAENDALRQANERLVAANKARAEYLTTRRAGNDVDSYVDLAEAKIAALRSRLAEAKADMARLLRDGIVNAPCPTPGQWRQLQDLAKGYLAGADSAAQEGQ